jgi:hypothetical protein
VELARRYWLEVIQPIVEAELAASQLAVALIGHGSDVLGFDTRQSTDHGWGPRLLVFVPASDTRERAVRLDQRIDETIPDTFLGYPTRFPARDGDPARYQVRVTNLPSFFADNLGFDPTRSVTNRDWLATPSQLLRAVTGGAVFADGPGRLTQARRRLAWYPDDVWIYLLGCQWRRLDQEEPFVGRGHQVGDQLGATLIAARLVWDLMRLCFLIERQYAPYAKWLGTAFGRLDCAPRLAPLLGAAVAAPTWGEREQALATAFEHVAGLFNALGLVEPLEPRMRPFYQRPFRVLGSGRFADACLAVTPLRNLGPAGGIDQFVDSTDILADVQPRNRLRDGFWQKNAADD